VPLVLATSFEELKNIFVMQGFAGFSLFAVFLLMALGLAIIFGQMKVINMAHGEFLTVGAYVTVFMSHLVMNHAPNLLPYYFPVAIFAAFLVAAILGYIVEIGLVRYLYTRPLDTLLATWGLSMILQQACRSLFGAREDTATLPEWMMGSWQPSEDLDIPKNSMFLLALAIGMVVLVYFLLHRSRWGLNVRATMQNREMAGAVGINTKRVDRMTFSLGCGLAGVAGAAFIVLAATLAAVGTVPVESVAIIFGVHRLMSQGLTPTNLIGNGVATLVVAKWEGALDERRLQAALGGHSTTAAHSVADRREANGG